MKSFKNINKIKFIAFLLFILLNGFYMNAQTNYIYLDYYDTTKFVKFPYKKVYRTKVIMNDNSEVSGFLYKIDSNTIILSSIHPKNIDSANKKNISFTKTEMAYIKKIKVCRNGGGRVAFAGNILTTGTTFLIAKATATNGIIFNRSAKIFFSTMLVFLNYELIIHWQTITYKRMYIRKKSKINYIRFKHLLKKTDYRMGI